MSTKHRSDRLPSLLATLGLLLGLAAFALPARAGEETPPSTGSSCLSCHEDLYYRFDTGRHYCLTEAANRCVDCHAGDPTALQAEAAHAGLVRHPILNGDLTRCQACHVEDAEAHAATFSALAGTSPQVLIAEQTAPAEIPARETEARVDSRTVAALAALLAAVGALLAFCVLMGRACRS